MSKILGPNGQQINKKAVLEARVATLEMACQHLQQALSFVTQQFNMNAQVVEKAFGKLGISLEDFVKELNEENDKAIKEQAEKKADKVVEKD